MNESIDLRQYGLPAVYEQQEESGLQPARVIAQDRGAYRIVGGSGEKLAAVSGKFRFGAAHSAAYPAVGDFVLVNWNPAGDSALIEAVLPRRSCFVRKAAGDARQEQVVAANIDTVFLCMALNQDFNLRRLERLSAIAWDSGAAPVVVLTKADLCSDPAGRAAQAAAVALGMDVIVTTAAEPDGAQQLTPFLAPGKTVAFIGSSGVGKSTLINYFLGQARQKTNGLRGDDKGRHTTTRRELIRLPGGALVIDTPGMREFGLWEHDAGISQTFADLEALAAQCRFRDCTHTGEPGCAVRCALDSGALQPERWQSYQKLKAETAYQEDRAGYLQAKGRREKEISKLIKQLPVKP